MRWRRGHRKAEATGAGAHKLQVTVAQMMGIRRLVRWQLALTVTAVLVVAFAVYLFIRQHDNAVSNCEAGNRVKAQAEQLWFTLFNLAAKDSTTKPTPEAVKLTAVFLADVKSTYAAVNCTAQYPFW
jgi:hypothetical protein